MQLCTGERDQKNFEKGDGEKNFEFMFYETVGGLNPKSVGGCEIF